MRQIRFIGYPVMMFYRGRYIRSRFMTRRVGPGEYEFVNRTTYIYDHEGD